MRRFSPLLQRAVAPVLLMYLLATPGSAEDGLHLRWNELSPVITGKRVWLPLQGGVRVAGTVREVQPAGLTVEVTRTSDRKAFPKGLASIPRSSVSTIRVNRPAGHKGILIGAAIGGGIGATAGGVLIAQRRNEGGIAGDAIIATAVVAPIAIGLLLGWLSDFAAHHGGKTITVIASPDAP